MTKADFSAEDLEVILLAVGYTVEAFRTRVGRANDPEKVRLWIERLEDVQAKAREALVAAISK